MLCYVVQPNKIVLEVIIPPKAKGQEVLEKACELLGIRTEMDYFGLKYSTMASTNSSKPNDSPNMSLHWLNLRNSVERQVPCLNTSGSSSNNSSLPFRRFVLAVKFWVPPHLVLQESTRSLMSDQAKEELKAGRLLPKTVENRVKLAALICQTEYDKTTWSPTRYVDWAQILNVEVSAVATAHEEFKSMKRVAAEYWVLKEVSYSDEFGEEIYTGTKGVTIGIGPHGVRIYGNDSPPVCIPYSSGKSTSTHRRTFHLIYLNSEGIEESLEIKCESVAMASCLYRSLTERHDFYSCDTVRGAVTSQYIRDLKGTIASIFNEGTPLGKKYVFDIRRTCREVHDGARRTLYSLNNIGETSNDQPNSEEMCSGDGADNASDGNLAAERLLTSVKELFTCRVCMDGEIDTVFFPCAHVVCCSSCSTMLTTCPLCRSTVSTFHRLYLPKLPS